MVNLQLNWQQGTALAAVLLVGRFAAVRSRRGRRAAPYLQESAIVALLYSLWQLAASISVVGARGAFARARWIEHAQAVVGLPSERSVQSLIVGHRWLAQGCNLYYAGMHFGGLGVFLLWMFVRHRSAYARVRNVLVLLTATCLVIQLLPVAPPRLLPDLGFVDVAARYGQSVYNLSGITVDSLSAMPSVHVGWALLIGWAVVSVSSSRHRWWVLLHPVLTIFVVVATGNHFWSDGIVAAVILAFWILAVTRIDARRMSARGTDDRDPYRTAMRHAVQGPGDIFQADLADDQRRRVQ
jgi:hypothetical protein